MLQKWEFNRLRHNRVWEQNVGGETGVPITRPGRWHKARKELDSYSDIQETWSSKYLLDPSTS